MTGKPLVDNAEAQRLVGAYLQAWNAMESVLNGCIAAALHLGTIEGAIATSNMQLRDKIHTLRSLLSLAISDKAKRKGQDDQLVAIQHASAKRNLIAHTPFWAAESGEGVEFLAIKAKGAFSMPKTLWTPADFAVEMLACAGFSHSLEAIKTTISDQSLLRALVNSRWPIAPFGGPSPLGLPGLLAPDFLGSDQPEANPQTTPQTPEAEPQ